MRQFYQEELNQLDQQLIEMGRMVEVAIEDAVKALTDRDKKLAGEVIRNDDLVNKMEKTIENRCLMLIVKEQPVAGDLRLISSILKIITDLERVGDQATDIAEISTLFGEQPFIKKLTHIPQMADATIKMLSESINAFVTKDQELAREVIKFDDVVDNLFDVIKNELIEMIHNDREAGEQAINFLMIAKYLERIGDHAENIAEWVLFSISGYHSNGTDTLHGPGTEE